MSQMHSELFQQITEINSIFLTIIITTLACAIEKLAKLLEIPQNSTSNRIYEGIFNWCELNI